jgi:putative chitinase
MTPTAFRPIPSSINNCIGGLKMLVSDNHLAEIMPNLSSAKRALYMPFLQQALEEFEINTPLRLAAFLPQVAHESAEFRFISDPSRAALPEVGFRTAGIYWKRNGLNELADKRWFKTITKRINPALRGLEDRTRYYVRAKRVLGIATRGTEEDYAPDDPGDDSGLPLFTRGGEGGN